MVTLGLICFSSRIKLQHIFFSLKNACAQISNSELFYKGIPLAAARRRHNAVSPPPQIVQHQRLSGKPGSLFCPAFFFFLPIHIYALCLNRCILWEINRL